MAMLALVPGCSTTVESQPAAVQSVESGGTLPSDITGFFGADAAKLQPGGKGRAALVWVNPSTNWSTYTKILVEPV